MTEVEAESQNSSVRILIAEDEAIIRLDLVETLEAEGYEILGSTGRGDEAVQMAVDLEPDVVLLDIKMPGATGLEAARQISAKGRSAVVILTAFGQRDLVDDARSAGAMAYLVKPYRLNDLVPAIELALARFRELRDTHGQVDDLEQRLADRKIVDRAKGHLMDRFAMSESDAFVFLQRAAMSGRRRMAEVSSAVLDGSLEP